MKVCIIILLVYYFCKYKSCIKYNNLLLHLNKILKRDYVIYKKCVNITHKIDCGRSKSILKKMKKIIPTFKEITFFIPNKTISKNLKKCSRRRMLFLIGIDTGPDYFIERYIYRKFYSKLSNIDYFFFCGSSINNTINGLLENENKIYKDIVIFPFISTYYTSSLIIASELKWVRQNCRNYKWYIHHQADVYINIRKTINFLSNINCVECAVGRIRNREKISRNKSDIFYLPKYLYPNKTIWPKYLLGPFIFFSNKSLEILHSLIGKVYPQFWADDLYIGLMFSYTKIKLIEIGYAHIFGDPSISLQTANFYYVVHGLNPVELYYLINQ